MRPSGRSARSDRRIEEIEAELAAFEQHPDAAIYRSMPGLGAVRGNRVLGEFGDDTERYDSVKSRPDYEADRPSGSVADLLTVLQRWLSHFRARELRNDAGVDQAAEGSAV